MATPPAVADPAGALALPSPPLPRLDHLPTTLPVVTLTEDEKLERYGIPHSELPRLARNSMQAFHDWCTTPINLERGQEYAGAVQSTSIEKTLGVIRGYLGWCCLKQGVKVADVNLHLYADVHKFAKFMGYLIARDVRNGQLVKQIAVAKKVSEGG